VKFGIEAGSGPAPPPRKEKQATETKATRIITTNNHVIISLSLIFKKTANARINRAGDKESNPQVKGWNPG
jgi:hypothetical protein